jgi:hypothetical protein
MILRGRRSTISLDSGITALAATVLKRSFVVTASAAAVSTFYAARDQADGSVAVVPYRFAR